MKTWPKRAPFSEVCYELLNGAAKGLLLFRGESCEKVVRHMGESVSESGELRDAYDESRKQLGISEDKVWVQRTPIGQSIILY